MKKINKIIFFIIVFFGILTNVNAEPSNILDFNKPGSINITLTEKEENIAIEGVELSIYRVANAKEVEHNLRFEYTKNFNTCPASLLDLDKTSNQNEIINCLTTQKETSKEITNTEGKVEFKNLRLGLYIVKQTNEVEGYSKIEPYIIMLPNVVDNKWTYKANSEPKTEIYKTFSLQVLKVWNKQDPKSKIPEEVTIELYKGEELIDTIKLNNENNWTHTWRDIEKSDSYTVKEINIPKGYTVTYKQDGYVFTVTNTDELPFTGQQSTSIIILTISGFILIVSGIYLRRVQNEK